MRAIHRALLAAFLTVGVLASAARADEPKLPELTVDEVAQKIAAGQIHVFDNNPRDVWQTNHVPGAKWVDYEKVGASDLPSDKSATLVFYCANEH